MNLRRALVVATIAALALGGCAGLSGRSDPIPAEPAAIELFELNGRVNVRVKAENKGYPGKIRWQHQGPKEALWIYTPLGTLVARLIQDTDKATITTAQGEEFTAGTLSFLSRDVLGYDLPVDALQYWIRGLEWPKGRTVSLVKDEAGRPASLAQDKWQVTYLAWTSKESPSLPTKMNVENAEMKLSLVVDQWKFHKLDRE